MQFNLFNKNLNSYSTNNLNIFIWVNNINKRYILINKFLFKNLQK